MPLTALDHINLRTRNLESLTTFYQDILGLEVGPRPPFSFPGAWLYVNLGKPDERAVVHLIGVEADTDQPVPELQLEHFAFSADDKDAFIATLEARGIEYRASEVPGFKIMQVNIWDPDGNHLHVDFKI